MSKNHVKKYNQCHDNDNTTEVENTDIEFVQEEISDEEDNTEEVTQEIKPVAVEEYQEPLTITESVRNTEGKSRQEVLLTRIKYLTDTINKSHNAVTKGVAYEKLKVALAEFKELNRENKTDNKEIKALDNYDKVADRNPNTFESAFVERGQVVGVEGMFVRF